MSAPVWHVRQRAGYKVIHRSTCPRRTDAPVYIVLDGCETPHGVVWMLVDALPWHIACRVCARDVDTALADARRARRGAA